MALARSSDAVGNSCRATLEACLPVACRQFVCGIYTTVRLVQRRHICLITEQCAHQIWLMTCLSRRACSVIATRISCDDFDRLLRVCDKYECASRQLAALSHQSLK